MTMKTLFTILLMALFSVNSWPETKPAVTSGKAVLSYALPSKLDWSEVADDVLGKGLKIFTLGEDHLIRISSMQVANDQMWSQVSGKSAEEIYKNLVDGKRVVHTLAGYKKWKAEKKLTKKSNKEIVFELTGSFIEDSVKKLFVEKYYMTPYGFIMVSLDWSEKADLSLAKKAQAEFDSITFKSEIL